MQLTARASRTGLGEATATGVDQTLADYNSRRCHICGAKYPPFGFGPPLTRLGVELFACGAHRAEVDHIASADHTTTAAPEPQLSLL